MYLRKITRNGKIGLTEISGRETIKGDYEITCPGSSAAELTAYIYDGHTWHSLGGALANCRTTETQMRMMLLCHLRDDI